AAKQLTPPAPRVGLIVALYRLVEEFEVAHAVFSCCFSRRLARCTLHCSPKYRARLTRPSIIFFSLSESNLVVNLWWRRRRRVHAIKCAVEFACVASLEFDGVGDDLEVLARRCDLDMRHRQQLILSR